MHHLWRTQQSLVARFSSWRVSVNLLCQGRKSSGQDLDIDMLIVLHATSARLSHILKAGPVCVAKKQQNIMGTGCMFSDVATEEIGGYFWMMAFLFKEHQSGWIYSHCASSLYPAPGLFSRICVLLPIFHNWLPCQKSWLPTELPSGIFWVAEYLWRTFWRKDDWFWRQNRPFQQNLKRNAHMRQTHQNGNHKNPA